LSGEDTRQEDGKLAFITTSGSFFGVFKSFPFEASSFLVESLPTRPVAHPFLPNLRQQGVDMSMSEK